MRVYSKSNMTDYVSLCRQGVDICDRILSDIIKIREIANLALEDLKNEDSFYEKRINYEFDLDEHFAKISANLEHLASFYGKDFNSKMKGGLLCELR